ncbi:phosphoglycerate mutase-like protein [Coprinellus micaceus]|uniref:Phosphoglycerate mutase-like protein n=1 Tax=Coprinellus micaceus TaxID=71717 RepID=A0A4Y7TAK6_COPMI|nr:phosphoglycerate mutase-like protein [Coprinellus micaceus]
MSGVPRYSLLLTALFSRANHSACGLTPDDMIHRDLASWDLNSPLLPPQEDGWCNMPHVTVETYITPPEGYVLRYAEVIQRHHKRTPYSSNLFYQEDTRWECGTSPVQWQVTQTTTTIFQGPQKQPVVTSSCQFPQLTPEGFQRLYRPRGCTFISETYAKHSTLGRFYGTRLGISEAFTQRRRPSAVTNNPLTSQVASGLLQDALRTSFTTGPNGSAWKEHLQTVQGDGTFAALDGVSGIRPDDGEWTSALIIPSSYFDNLRARECHSMPLPCNLANSTLCVSPELAQMVYSVGNWEYSYLYRDAPGALEYSIRKFGVWMLELESHLRAAIAGKSQVRYRHNVAHDGSISSLLGFLQVSKMAWPGMGSEVAFELYERSGESWYVRVLWSGTVIETSTNLGRLDMVPADEFVQYIRSLIPSGEWLVQAC